MSGSELIAIDSVTDYGTREAWLAARRQLGIGASESAALFGISPFESRLSLWLQKTGRVPDWEPTGDDAERLEWGQVLEGPIADVYGKRSGRKLWGFSAFSVARHPSAPAFATPDRFIIEAPDRREKGLPEEGALQVKNTANIWGRDSWADGVPLYVQCQVQHEMWVTGRPYVTVATLANGNKLLTWDVERNDDFIAELERVVCEFWEDVQREREPPVDGHPRTLEAIKRLHPLDNGQTIALPGQALAYWEQLRAAKAAIKAAQEKADEAEAQLKALIGPNTFALLPDGRRLSFKTIENQGHTTVVKPYKYRTLRETTPDVLAVAKHKKGKAA